jgi:hypothetical protein
LNCRCRRTAVRKSFNDDGLGGGGGNAGKPRNDRARKQCLLEFEINHAAPKFNHLNNGLVNRIRRGRLHELHLANGASTITARLPPNDSLAARAMADDRIRAGV